MYNGYVIKVIEVGFDFGPRIVSVLYQSIPVNCFSIDV